MDLPSKTALERVTHQPARIEPLLTVQLHTFSIRCSAQNKSEGNSNKTGTRTLGNQVIRKGNLTIQNLGIMKGKFASPKKWP